jgi:hypothetical protein
MSGRAYTEAERDEILRRAAERAAKRGESIGHDELVAAAGEVGIDADEVERAAREIEEERATQSEKALAKELVARHRRERWRRLGRHAASYAAVNGGLLALNLLIGGPLWALFPITGWGIGLAMHLIGVALAPTPDERTVRRMLEKEARQREREARRRRQAERAAGRGRSRKDRAAREAEMRAAASDFEEAVERGVAELLRAAAWGLEHAARESAAEALRGMQRRPGATPPPRVRVEVEAREVEPRAPAERTRGERGGSARRGKR